MTQKKVIKKKSEKGTSLVEVLISMLILMILLVGILQMFAAAFVINNRSSLKTLEAYKCQQVAENMRMARRIQAATGVAPGGIAFVDGTISSLPYNSSGAGWDYWGPAGCNIIEQEDAPYRLFYRVTQTAGAPTWTINVTAVDSKLVLDGQDPFASQTSLRRVEYVTQIAN